MSGKIPKEIINGIKIQRSNGLSVPEISDQLNVSKTTVLRYIKDVEILPEYLSEWASKRGGSKKRKIQLEKEALDEGIKVVGRLNNKEKLLFLSALYWAEGNKKDFILTNTDPNLIKTFINVVREVLGISDDRIKVSIRLYEDLDREKSLSFWSNIVAIPKEKFVSVNVLEGKKIGKLEYGMCRIRISKGGSLLKKIIGINSAVVRSLAL